MGESQARQSEGGGLEAQPATPTRYSFCLREHEGCTSRDCRCVPTASCGSQAGDAYLGEAMARCRDRAPARG
jgi:hypothetical protein